MSIERGRRVPKLWKPNMSNVIQRIPKKNLLKKATKKLKAEFPLETLKDSHGTYGYRFGHYVLLAKDYIYGNIVSVHRKALGIALTNSIPILLYINDADAFYEFDPQELLKVTNQEDDNVKGQEIMRNFSIKLGKRFEVA